MNEQQTQDVESGTYTLLQFFESALDITPERTLSSELFVRNEIDFFGRASVILDSFPDAPETSCCFIRLNPGEERTVKFVAEEVQLESCQSGGWLLTSLNSSLPSFWIPQPPVLRDLDNLGHILSEDSASSVGFKISSEELVIDINVPKNMHLDVVIWRFAAGGLHFREELEQSITLEKQKIYYWNSHTIYQSLADLYLYLINGNIYVKRFVWPRKWKFFSDLDAYGLFITLNGLELATKKIFYNLLKRQILISVIARQAPDGGWYHGEWTDLMESHYRFHNGALQLLEAALQEWPDEIISRSLEKGASFISEKFDRTDIGLWFLHDSLEDSAESLNEMIRQSGQGRWYPSRLFGKKPTNKLIFNTHLDSIVTLHQYSLVSGDDQYRERIDSAREATRHILELKPAETLYRLIYRAINLLLMPSFEARQLPLPIRAIKRFTWMYLCPQLFRIKRLFPRLVMPGGFTERHLSMPHCDFNYHAVNILDLVRLWRCFPEEDLSDVLNNAITAVSDTSLIRFWAESDQRQWALVVYIDAIYQLCTLKQSPIYRRYLAEAILQVEAADIGLPPSLLGGDSETIANQKQTPPPSPIDSHLRLANIISIDGQIEILVVNGTTNGRKLDWDMSPSHNLRWQDATGQSISNKSNLIVPAKGWLLGKASL